jgi:hypothetical protein
MLLQPSAVLLAVWHIVRLPVCFRCVSLRPNAVKEERFRLELLGLSEWQDSSPVQAAQAHACKQVIGWTYVFQQYTVRAVVLIFVSATGY